MTTDYNSIIEELKNYYANLLIIQYHNKPKAVGMIKDTIEILLSDAILFKIRDGFNLDTAVGVQLDTLAEWVGLKSRVYDGGQPLYPWFSYIDWSQTTTDENQGGFQNWDETYVTDGGFLGYDDIIIGKNAIKLNDDMFRFLIKLKIIKNSSTHTMKDLDDRLYEMFGNKIYIKWGYSSLYNSSAFTVVGSPTITDDGIASGFSSSNYLTGSLQSISNEPFKIIAKVNTGTPGKNRHICRIGNGSGTDSTFLINSYNYLTMWYVVSDGTTRQDLTVNYPQTIPANTDLWVKAENDGSQHWMSISYDGKTWLDGSKKDSTLPLTTSTLSGFIIGTYKGASSVGDLSIDLKQFSITVDGEEVFSGEKDQQDNVETGGMSLTYNYTNEFSGLMELAKQQKMLPAPTGMLIKYNEL